MKGKDKMIKNTDISEEPVEKVQEKPFMFPHGKNPVTVYAKNMQEAQEKYKKLSIKEK